MQIRVKSKGSFKKTLGFLRSASDLRIERILRKYGQMGVEALAAATPERTGQTAAAWGYKIVAANGSAKIEWTNDNINDGQNVAILIQYGHGTGTGGYVEGMDFINPALKPVLDKIRDEIWDEVSNA